MNNQEERSIVKWVSVLYRQFQVYIYRALKGYDLNSSEYVVLINIAQNEGVSQKFLADEIIIDQALITRVMKSLEKKGLITREKSTRDKREYIIYLTEEGKKMQPIIVEKLKHWTDILSGGLEPEEVDNLIIQLKMMSGNALQETRGEKK